jgi:hypothetical protein
MNPKILRSTLLVAAAWLGLFLGGCATQRPAIALPYEFPATGSPAAGLPTARVTTVTDHREDRTLDPLLSDKPVELVQKAIEAELAAKGVYAFTSSGNESAFAIHIAADLREMSWAVPNHSKMVKTAFWTSFLTGGIGGLAYGSTDTPVFGRAVVHLKLTEPSTGRVVLDQAFDAVHEERMAKLKCDLPQTRARMMAAALKAALVKATAALSPATAAGAPAAAESP